MSVLPDDFLSIDQMMSIIKKTVEKSWLIDMDSDDVFSWLDNFSGEVFSVEDERSIALWLLCNYSYYNNFDVDYLCRILFKYFIHDILITYKVRSTESLLDLYKNMFFSSLGRAGESGGLILYHFRQAAMLSIDRFYYPTSIPHSDSNILIFVDDCTLSGGTAERFYHQHLKDKEYSKIYYLTVLASRTAVQRLDSLGIKTIYCTQVDERDKCFSENSMVFGKYPSLRQLANEMALHYGGKICPQKPLGHKDGQLCFSFYYNTPNNTLPIFWSDQNNWSPLFPRKEKVQNDKQFIFPSDRFI